MQNHAHGGVGGRLFDYKGSNSLPPEYSHFTTVNAGGYLFGFPARTLTLFPTLRRFLS